MRKAASFALSLFFCLNAVTMAATEEIISRHNEYGGLTQQITYSDKDPDFSKGIYKIVASYDSEGRKKKMELYATKSHSNEAGWYKKVIYYWERKKISEAYSTDSDSLKNGFHRMVSYYDKNNVLEKREYYLNKNTTAAKLGVYKRVVHYDKNGKVTYVEDLDYNGTPVLIK